MHYASISTVTPSGKETAKTKVFSLDASINSFKAGSVRDSSQGAKGNTACHKWWRDQVMNVVPELKFA